MSFHKSGKGFTFIEVLVAVAILALLVIIAIQAMRNKIDRANDALRKSDLQKISSAFEEYYTDHDCYPPSSILNDCGGNGLSPYLFAIPCDPVYKTPYCYVTDAVNPVCFQKFRVLNTLKNMTDPIIKQMGCDSNQYCGWEPECGYTKNSGFNYGVSSTNTLVANPAIINPGLPPPLPTPAGGPWGCTSGGDCNHFGDGYAGCKYEFPDETCGGGLYCAYTMYQCVNLP